MASQRVGGIARIVTNWPAGQPGGVRAVAALKHFDGVAGPYRIAGTVAIAGTPDTPVRRRVRLFVQITGQIVRQTWSNAATGAFEFAGLAQQPYIVLADDYTAIYNAVPADAVLPVL